MTTINTSDYVTTAEAAVVLDVTSIRVRQFCREDRLPCEKIAGRLLISKKALESFGRIERKVGRPKR